MKNGERDETRGTLPNFDSKSVRDYRTFVLDETSRRTGRLRAAAGYLVRRIRRPQRHDIIPARELRLRGTADQQLGHGLSGGREALYEPIIEQVHRDYRLSHGNCKQRMTAAGQDMPR